MKKSDRFKAVLKYFSENFPDPKTELNFKNPYELLVAVILSAQCTDKRVNIVTPNFFKSFPSPKILAKASKKEVFNLISSISFPNNKAKHLVQMASLLVDEYQAKIPSEVNELIKLPGVGRKTANVIASVIYNKPTMAVDTHVFRVSNRIGLTTNSKSPDQTERELVKFIPKELIPKAHHWLILHGRYVCKARKPLCYECRLKECCKFYSSKKNRYQSSL
jgi:endonuclease-3